MAEGDYKKVALTFTSLVAAGTTMDGNYTGKANLLVEGTVTGDVRIKGAVYVAEAGSVNGNIEADFAVIGGKVSGNVIASKNAEIKSTGTVGGYVFARELLVGAKGKVKGDIGAAKKRPVTYEPYVSITE